jgi:hypothetical protein
LSSLQKIKKILDLKKIVRQNPKTMKVAAVVGFLLILLVFIGLLLTSDGGDQDGVGVIATEVFDYQLVEVA